MIVSRRYLVRGRVQAVGFRQFTWDAARVEGVRGWVRNREDGSVEVMAEGERDAVDRLERRIRRGPPGARVEAVEVEDAASGPHGGGFEVR